MIQGMAVQVVCTGKEDRLLDCEFPENFNNGDVSPYDYGGRTGSAADIPSSAPGPATGIASGCGESDAGYLAVVCRSFEVTGEFRLPANALEACPSIILGGYGLSKTLTDCGFTVLRMAVDII